MELFLRTLSWIAVSAFTVWLVDTQHKAARWFPISITLALAALFSLGPTIRFTERLIAVLQERYKNLHDRQLIRRHRRDSRAPYPNGPVRTAYHEIAHALVRWHLAELPCVDRVTIVRHADILGFVASEAQDPHHLTDIAYFKASIAVSMAGRAGEMLVYGESSSGSATDLQNATRTAVHMLNCYGMGPYLTTERELGDTSWKRVRAVERHAEELLREGDETAARILIAHRHELEATVAALLEKGVLRKNDLDVLFGERPKPAPKESIIPGTAN